MALPRGALIVVEPAEWDFALHQIISIVLHLSCRVNLFMVLSDVVHSLLEFVTFLFPLSILANPPKSPFSSVSRNGAPIHH